MTLIFAFLFSFSILWRYVLVFPFLLLAMIVFGFIFGILIFLISLVSPAVAIMIVVALALASTVFPVIVGMRLGMQAKGLKPRNTYFGLMLPAIGYGLIEAICILLITGISVAIYFFATGLSLQDLGSFAGLDEDALVEQLLAVNPAVTLSLLWVASVLIIGLRAALLVPFAGASIGVDPNGRAHTPFYGFGSGFLSMLILVAICYIGSSLVVPAVAFLGYTLGYGDTLLAAMTELERAQGMDVFDVFGLEVAVFILLCILGYLWMFSLQAAGAVLIFAKHKEDVDDAQHEFDRSMDVHLSASERPMQQEDVMALVRERMKNR